MSAVRRLVEDLVEKRLWPVALALVVALVAIPVLIGGGNAEPGDPAPIPPPSVSAESSATPAVALVGPPSVRSRPGKVRDPFRRTPPPKADAAKTASSSSSSSSSSGAKPASSSGSAKAEASKSGGTSGPSESSTKGSTPSPATAVKPVAPTAALATRSLYETVARFRGPGWDYEHPLDRLAVLGGKDNPALQYLGVSRGGEYAIFLLGPTATAAGDTGACIVADPCRAIGLRRGEKLDVVVADIGEPARRYELEVTRLRRVTLASASAALRERLNVADDGRAVLRTLAEDIPTAAALGRLRYGPATGTITLVGAP